jgi:hypothetical protein
MDIKQAREIGSKYWHKYANIAVLSDGSVFLNADIETIKSEAEKNKLEVFITKGYENYGGTNKKSKRGL